MKKLNITNLKQITKLYGKYIRCDVCNSFANPVYYKGNLWIINGVSAAVLSKEYLPQNNEFLFNIADRLPTYGWIESLVKAVKDMFNTAEKSEKYYTFRLEKSTLKDAIKVIKDNQGVKNPLIDLGGVYVNAKYLLDHIGITRRKSALISINGKKDPVIISNGDGAMSLLMPCNVNEDTLNRDEIITLQSVNAYV